MKKIIIAAIALCTVGFANAQGVAYGAKVGLNVANQSFTGTGAPSTSSLVGVSVGGFAEFKLAGKFGIQPEVMYSTQGSKLSMTDSGVTLNSFKLDYIIVPVMLKYYSMSKLSFEVGPQIGFLTSAKVNASASGNTSDVDAKQLFKSADFGVNFGVGFEIVKQLSVGVRYNLGLTNVASSDFATDGDKVTNSVLTIGVSTKF